MNYKRKQYYSLKERIREKRRFIQVIMGPRQVGKTYMVNQLIEESKDLYTQASADNSPNADIYWLKENWNAARFKYKQSKSKKVILVIDEIQKIHNWSETVKGLWDEDTKEKLNIQVIILGSSSLLIDKGLSESLAGRFEIIFTPHWSYSEMRDAFGWNVNQYVWFGGYPGSAEIIKNELRWKNYIKDSLIETSISKDILLLTRIDKPALMRKLFELGCFYSGQILSYTKMTGQLQDAGNTTTLAHYLKLLDTACLIRGIEKYSKNEVRQKGSSPKFIVYNTGLISGQTDEMYKDIINSPSKFGRCLESAVGSHLINNERECNYKVFYWRQGDCEVDYVLKKQNKLIALEVTASSKKNTSGMKLFNKLFKPDKIYLVGNEGIRWQEFLAESPENLF
ncbi:MAG: ATP-binding protein [Ignavibacteriae bacterium]|nr:ATP-binding protein [Ignavibacteriota bacterium]